MAHSARCICGIGEDWPRIATLERELAEAREARDAARASLAAYGIRLAALHADLYALRARLGEARDIIAGFVEYQRKSVQDAGILPLEQADAWLASHDTAASGTAPTCVCDDPSYGSGRCMRHRASPPPEAATCKLPGCVRHAAETPPVLAGRPAPGRAVKL